MSGATIARLMGLAFLLGVAVTMILINVFPPDGCAP